MNNELNLAFSQEALFAKSQLYISRGLRAKDGEIFDEYQLWASLALELLAKSSLSKVHPALVADPQSYQSLFAACGYPLSPDVKTITAKTLFERLSHISKDFDKRIQDFCNKIALRRNSELHSGESPFSGMSLEAWEAQFWHAAYIILFIQNKNLEQWLGLEDAETPNRLLNETREAISMMVKTRISHALEDFEKQHKNQQKRDELIERSKHQTPWEYNQRFKYPVDQYQLTECPSCSGMGVLGGTEFDTELSDCQNSEDPFTEYVDITYASEEFICTVCNLHLYGTQEISAASLPNEFCKTEELEVDFEPDYGND